MQINNRNQMKKLFFFLAFFIPLATIAQDNSYVPDTPRVYPTNWWVGMHYSKPELMIHLKDIGNTASVTVSYPGVTLADWHRVENPDYLFLHLNISPAAKPGTLTLVIHPKGAGTPARLPYTLLPRRKGNGTDYAKGVTSSDFIYFLMPDRFSNGDPSNDRVPGLKDQSLNRDSIYFRHGGDSGASSIISISAISRRYHPSMTPVIENDMPNQTEHGYAFTDHYTIEHRFGGAEMYERLSFP